MPAIKQASVCKDGNFRQVAGTVQQALLACVFVALPTQIAQLKEWVTDNRLEDDDYFKMMQASKTKKSDWVEFVKQKLENAP
jgi:hypothetical protein